MSDEPKLRGYTAIAAVLSELFGDVVSDDAAYRLATRRAHALPVDGFLGRVYTYRSTIAAWVAAERRRLARAVGGVQLSVVAAPPARRPRNPRRARNPR